MRGETLGAIAEQSRRDEEFSADEEDEDISGPLDDRPPASSRNLTDERGPGAVAADEAPRREAGGEPGSSAGEGTVCADDEARATVQPVRPFAHLADLPADLAEAFEAFKLAILRHKTEGWSQISAGDVLASLECFRNSCGPRPMTPRRSSPDYSWPRHSWPSVRYTSPKRKREGHKVSLSLALRATFGARNNPGQE